MKKPKAKGNRTERAVCSFLKSWTGGEFNRVPASGGLRWKSAQAVYGDIVPPNDLEFPFIVEVKARKTLNVKLSKSGLLHVNSIFNTFYTQCYEDCLRYSYYAGLNGEEFEKRVPLVFSRPNYLKSGVYYVQVPFYIGRRLDVKLIAERQEFTIEHDVAFCDLYDTPKKSIVSYTLLSSEELVKIPYERFLQLKHD